MKHIRLTPVLAGIVALVVSSVMFASQAFATSATERPGKGVDPSPGTQSRSSQGDLKFSEKELEEFRADLLNFVQAYKEVAASLGMKKAVEAFEKTEEQLRQLTLKQLDGFRNVLPDTTKLNISTQRMHDGVELQRLTNAVEVSPFSRKSTKNTQGQSAGNFQIESAGFPDADYPSCGSTRVSDTIIDASDTALFVAEGVRDAASRACGQVAVVLGEGGNGNLACIATDAIYLAAKVVNYGLHYCNDKIDGAEQGATYERLGHIHTDIESSVANDNSNKTAIINNDNTNTTSITGAVTTATSTITANDNTNKTAIITNDNTNTANIIANSNANKGDVIINANTNTTTITTAISNAQTTIVNNANANATMLRDLILRTQIEADLASTDGSAFVALYLTPGAKGGYLELVRSIVVQTIANIGGANTAQANALLAKGDAYKTAGDYRSAYSFYRQAYKKAQGL